MRCEFRIRLADVGGGRVTADGGGIWRAERSGIGRGWVASCIRGLWTSAMIMYRVCMYWTFAERVTTVVGLWEKKMASPPQSRNRAWGPVDSVAGRWRWDGSVTSGLLFLQPLLFRDRNTTLALTHSDSIIPLNTVNPNREVFGSWPTLCIKVLLRTGTFA